MKKYRYACRECRCSCVLEAVERKDEDLPGYCPFKMEWVKWIRLL